MLYLKVSSSVLIAVTLICIIQNAISLTTGPQATEDKWSTLENSTDQNDLKKITKLCKVSLNNFNEKIENTKKIANEKLPELNNTAEDIANLVSEIKSQVKNASADLVTLRKLVQKSALRFRDTFKSLVSFTELDSESVNKELESIQKTTVDTKKPLVNRVIRSFGNRYDLNKLANKVLEISSDHENLKNNYDEKNKIVKKEFNSLWNSLSHHSKTMNDNALNALSTFFEGIKSVKYVKKKVKTLGENALDEIKVGDEIINLKNAVELAKSLKLKFEDEWNLDSGELTYSEEQKKSSLNDENPSYIQENEQDKSNENVSINDIETGLPKTEKKTIENDKTNVKPPTQTETKKYSTDDSKTSEKEVSPIEKTQLPSIRENKDESKIMQPTIFETEHNPMDDNIVDPIDSPVEENSIILDTKNKDKTEIVEPEVSNQNQKFIDDFDLKSNPSIQETSIIPDTNNDEELIKPFKDSTNSIRGKNISKRTSREKSSILPWETLIQLNNPWVSQQSMKCKNVLNNVTPDFDNINNAAKTSIQVTKNNKTLQKIENDTIKQFYDKMVDTNTKLCGYLVDAADNVCANITPINKRYETKFKNDPNIKRIKYLLGKQYDPYQYILKILYDANHRHGIGGMKKTAYYKMLAVAYNLKHETKEMDNAALYAMNKIYEGKLAANDLKKMFNKEKASKACFIRNILLEKENEGDKKNKEENEERVNECINEDTNTEPLKPEVNLDSVDALQQPTVNDGIETFINNKEGTKTSNENSDPDISSNANIKNDTESPEYLDSETVYSNEENIPHDESDEGNTSVKPKVKHLRRITEPNDGKEIYGEKKISDEEGDNNLNKLTDDNVNTLQPENNETSNEVVENDNDKALTPELLHNYDEGINDIVKEDVESENATREIDDLGDNENLNSIEGADLKCIKNENILPTAESMEEDSLSVESSNEKTIESPNQDKTNYNDGEHGLANPEDNQSWEQEPQEIDDHELKGMSDAKMDDPNDHDRPNDSYDETNTKTRHQRRRKGREDDQELPEIYTDETLEHESPEDYENIEKPTDNPEQDTAYYNDGEHDTVTPEENHSWEHFDNNHPNDSDYHPNSKRRHHRGRKDHDDDKLIPEGYNTDETPEYESPEVYENDDTPIESPDQDTTYYNDGEHDTATPEYNQSLEHEPQRMSEGEMDESNDRVQPNNGGNQADTKSRRNRRRKDRESDQELPESYNTGKNLEYESPEVDENAETPTESPEQDTTYYNDDEPQTERISNEDMDEPNDSNHQKDGDNSANIKTRHHIRRKGRRDNQELPEGYTDETLKHESPEVYENIETPSESPDQDTTYYNDGKHDTATPEYNQLWEHEPQRMSEEEMDESNGSVQPNNGGNQARNLEEQEPEEFDDHEPERMSDAEMDEPKDRDYSNYGVDQPASKRRRHRKRKYYKDDQELPESYTDETLEHESPEDYENVEKPTESPEKDTTYYNDGEPDSATPELNQSWEHADIDDRKPEGIVDAEIDEPNDGYGQSNTKKRHHRRRKGSEGDQELPESYNTGKDLEYESPEVDENAETPIESPEQDTTYYNDGEADSAIPEYNQSLEQEPEKIDDHEPERMSDAEMDEPKDRDYSNYGVDQPASKRRRHRKRKYYKDAQELPESYTDETLEHESPEDYENVEKPTESPEQDTTYYNDGEPDSATPELNQSWEHADIDDRKPEGIVDAEIDEPNDGYGQSNTKKRHHRRRKGSEGDQELPESYNTGKDLEYESPEVDENAETPIESPEQDTTYYNDGEADSAIPEYNQSLEQEPEEIDDHEPEPISDAEMDEPKDRDYSNYGVDQPASKRRRHRKRKYYKDDQELPESYTDETLEHESPEDYENVEKPTESPEQDTTYYNDGEPDSATPELNQSWEHADIDDRKPEGIVDAEIDEPNDGYGQSNTKKRHHRRRKGSEGDQELPESYNTGKDLEYESPEVDENAETPIESPEQDTTYYNDGEADSEIPEYNQSLEQEPEEIDDHEPERISDAEMDEPKDRDYSNYGVDQPASKRRRHRKRKYYKDDQELPESYTDETLEHESPEDYENVEKPTESPEQDTTYYNDGEPDSATPELNQSWEHADIDDRKPEGIIDAEIDEPNDGYGQSNTKKRHHRRRKGSEGDQELPESYNTGNDLEYESPEVDENAETPIESPEQDTTYYNDGEADSAIPEYNQSWEQEPEKIDDHEPERMSDAEMDEPKDRDYSNYGVDQPASKRRRHRKRKYYKDAQELPESYTDETLEHESPEDYENVEKPTESPEQDTTYYNDGEPDSATPELNQSWEHADIDDRKPEGIVDAEIDEPNDGYGQSNTKKRHHRRRKGSEGDQELLESYNTGKDLEYESPEVDENAETPIESPEQDTTYYNDGEADSAIPEYNQSLEQEPEEIDDHEPEPISDAEMDEPKDRDYSNYGVDQPASKRRRHRKRKYYKDDQELPESYTDETLEHESPEDYENVEKPTESPEQDTTYYNDGETDSATPELNQSWEHADIDDRKPEGIVDAEIDEPNDGYGRTNTKKRHHRRRKGREDDQELPEGYTDDTLEHESPEDYENIEKPTESREQDTAYYNDGEHDTATPEYNQSWEHEPQRMSEGEMDESNGSVQPNYVGNRADTNSRRNRRRKGREDDQELPESYNTGKNLEYESPEVDENAETPTESPEQDTSYYNDGEPVTGIPEYNQSLEQEPEEIDDHEPERMSDAEMNEPKDRDYSNYGVHQPASNRRRHRKRKYHKDDQELPESYTDETLEHESPEGYENIEKPTESPEQDTAYYDGEHDSETPENNHSWDHFDSNHPNDGYFHPNTNRRLHRRKKDHDDDQVIPEGYNTDKTPEYESPEVYEVVKSPTESHEQDSTYYNDGEPDPATPEYNQSWEHYYSDNPNDSDYDPNTKRRHNRGRKYHDDDKVIPEGYNTDETPEYESPEVYENVETPTQSPKQDITYYNDGEPVTGIPEYNQSLEQEPEEIDDHEPERISDAEMDEPKDRDYSNYGVDQPASKRRRHRKRKYDKDDQELPESYTDETLEHESPEDYENIEKPTESPEQDTTYYNDGEPVSVTPEYNRSWQDENELPGGYNIDKNPEYESPELYENIETPMYTDNAIETPGTLPPNVVEETINGKIPRSHNIRRRRKLGQPKTFNENYNEPEVVNDRNVSNYSVENQYVKNNNCPCNGKNNLNICSHIHGTRNSNQPRRKNYFTTMKNPTVDNITPHNLNEYGRIQNDEESVKNLKTQQNYPGINQKRKRRLRRVITYKVNKATNERIKVNEQTFTTTDVLPHTPRNKLESIKTEDSDDRNTNKYNNDYSSFLFKEYNTDLCKRDAYDRFKEVHSQKAKDFVYQIFLDTNKMRSNILTTVKNAIGNVKVSKTINDVDQSLKTVSYSLKTDLKQTVSDLVTKVTPLAIDFLETANNLRCLYKKGPRTTYKMLSNILKNESTIPDSAKDVLKLISPQFDVDELIDNILEKPCTTKTLKEKKAKAQRKLIDLSKHMDTAINNIDCCVLSAMSSVGIGADTLKLLKSGKVIMGDEHPRVKTLRDALGLIKSGQKIINNNQGFTSTFTPLDGTTENDKYNDDEDSDKLAQKNENILKTVPNLKDNMTLPKKATNKRHPLGVIVVHPNNDIDYKEVTDTSQLKKFVGDQSKKYKLLYNNNHPTFLKPNNNKLFYSMVADVKKKAETNGMSKKEMVHDVMDNLKSR